MKIAPDSACSFCKIHRENIQHLFWHCEYIRRFWNQFEAAVISKCDNITNLNLNEQIILFGGDGNFKSDQTFDFIVLLAKFFIYKSKINKSIPMYKDFKKYLENRYKIEIQASYVLMNTDKTYTDWYPYTPLFM
jgi:hypothetical protein